MQYAYRAKSFPHYFAATLGWNSTNLYGNLKYQEDMRISSPCSGQTLKLGVVALDKLCSLHIEQYSFPCYFSATTGWNSMKLSGNLQNQEELRISSPFTVRHFNS
jgi:hypothetical protein